MGHTPMQRALLFIATILYGVFFGIPAALLVVVVCLICSCCCWQVFRRAESPFTLFAGMAGAAASVLAMVVGFLLALPLLVPAAIVIGFLGACGLWRWDPPPQPGEGGAEGAATGSAAPPTTPSSAHEVVLLPIPPPGEGETAEDPVVI